MAKTLNSPKVGIVSLGCPKALVDSERILSSLRAEGYLIAPSYEDADVVLVNTCGFLDSARDESLDAIGEAIAENGKVIVTGCLGAEADFIKQRHPNVLAITGPAQYEQVVSAVHDAVPQPHDPYLDLIPAQGIKLTPRHYAYLKISEGCNHRCSFCIIPSMRGDLVSRPVKAVLHEAEKLVNAGVKELLVISQDTSAYGVDIRHKADQWRGRDVRAHMTELAGALGTLGAWVRLHYVYPYPHVDDVIPLMAQGLVLPYLDIPFQHASPKVLKAMRRPGNTEKVLERIHAWRAQVPDMTVRSTFIVGFPGETDADFEQLLDWMRAAQLDRVGCFKFEPVQGAAANALDGQVSDEVKEERWTRFMEVSQEISLAKQQAKVGRILEVLIDEVDDETVIGRSKGDAPEIDGLVYVDGAGDVQPGDIIRVKIEDADPYDLRGSAVE